MARRRVKRSRNRTGASIGEINWIIIAGALGLVAYFLQDSKGIGYNFVGSYLWIAAFAISFFLGLFYFCQFILPLDWKDSWFEGLRLTIGYNFTFIGAALGINSLNRKRRTPRGQRLAFLSKGFYRHRAGMAPSHLALVLSKESRLTRSAGPGFVRLKQGEEVSSAVDLRQHQREVSFQARSRDGIPLEGAISVTFRAELDETPVDEHIPFPAKSETIVGIVYQDSIGDSREKRTWIDHVCQRTADALIGELSRYSFDEFYQREAATGITPFEQVHRNILSEVTEQFDQIGIEVNDAAISYLDPPESVKDQRIANWQADWNRRKRIREAEGDIRVDQRIQLARARAQIEIVGNIARSIERMRKRSGIQLTDIVAMRTLEAVEDAITDDAVASLLPGGVRETATEVEQWIRRPPRKYGPSEGSNLGG